MKQTMDIIKAYYDHILDIFIEVYGETIKYASPGHCMKVTGLSSDVLRDLYSRLRNMGSHYFYSGFDPS